jgi:hypothetical protein
MANEISSSKYISETTKKLQDIIEHSGATNIGSYEFHVGDDSKHISVYLDNKVIQDLSVPGGIYDAEGICVKQPLDMNYNLKQGDRITLAILSDRLTKKDGTSSIVEVSFQILDNKFSLIEGSTKRMQTGLNEKTESIEWDYRNNRYIIAVQAINRKKHNDKYDSTIKKPTNNIGHFFAYYPKTGILQKMGKIPSDHPTDMHRDSNNFFVLTRDIGVLKIESLPEKQDEIAKVVAIAPFTHPNSEALLVKNNKAIIFLDKKEHSYNPTEVEFFMLDMDKKNATNDTDDLRKAFISALKKIFGF